MAFGRGGVVIRFDRKTSDEILKSHRICIDGSHAFFQGKNAAADIAQPQSSRHVALISKLISKCLCDSQRSDIFFKIVDWGVWPSEEFCLLFKRWSGSFGDARSLQEAPGFMFKCNENSDMEDFIRIIFYSGWSAILFSLGGGIGFVISENEWIGIFSTESHNIKNFIKEYRGLLGEIGILWSGET